MGHAVPTPSEMFSDASGVAVAQRFESYKGALSAEHQKAQQGGRGFVPGQGIVVDHSARATAIADRVDSISKSISPDLLAGVQGEIDALKSTVLADVGKDWSLTFPNSTGLVPYDLEAPSKLLVPRLTPLRNEIPRGKGQGTARQFKRILGWSNAGVGGVPDMSPFMNSQSVQTNFGSLALRRGAKITYASDSKSVAYVEMSLSDQVNWVAQFAGQGFQDIRSLSQTALLWAHMGGEERAMLYGRGSSGNGYAGNIAAPVIASSTATTGGTIAAGTYTIVVTAKGGFGETAVSNTATQVTTGATSTITVNVTTEPTGSLGVYRLYVSQAGGAVGTATFQTEFVGTSVTITAPPTSTGAVNAGAANTSSDALGYDGFLTVQSDPAQTGYFNRQNAALNAANPGDEFQVAFLAMYQLNKADPDCVYADGSTMKKLGDLLKTTSSASYKLNLDGDGHGHFLGATVVGLENQVTRKMVSLDVHPWMPQGCALIRSRTLPIPDSEVSATSEVINVQEYMAVDWPVVQFTYDQSTYQFGTLVHYAPAWSGLIAGIK
jgi:hypothetical protein